MLCDPIAKVLAILPPFIERPNALIDRGCQAGADAVLVELERVNVGRAIVEGGLGAEVQLGLAIGRLLTERA